MTKDWIIAILISVCIILGAWLYGVVREISRAEDFNIKRMQRVEKLREIDREKCIDLFLNDEI